MKYKYEYYSPGFKSKLLFFIQLICMLIFVYELRLSDSYYSPYICVFIFGIFTIFSLYSLKIHLNGRITLEIYVISILLSIMITLANYELWSFNTIGGLFSFLLILLGGIVAWKNILIYFTINIDKFYIKNDRLLFKPYFVFVVTFFIIFIINLIVLYYCLYPGNLSPDSISQMNQLLTNKYVNHHPFYHTITIKACIFVGLMLFHDINSAVALYSFISITVMACVFSFSIATLSELRVSKKIIALLIFYYSLMPVHIVYSMTMWKDVFFSASVLTFVICLFRCINMMSLVFLNYIGIIISGICICLYRSNGFFVFVLTSICFCLLYISTTIKIILKIKTILVLIIICGFVLKYPILNLLHVSQGDLVESLSIPIQQISRDVTENDDFTDEQYALLEQVIAVDRIPETYSNYISDPIKGLIRKQDNQIFIKQHWKEFMYLYMERLIKHPGSYARGWIDQTKGYWNSGYSYWWHYDYLDKNDLGIQRITRVQILHKLLILYLDLFDRFPPLQLFISIGVWDWMLLVCFYIAILRNDKLGVMLVVPSIMNVISLLIATPVFNELRYNYTVFCSIPIIFVLLLRQEEGGLVGHKIG